MEVFTHSSALDQLSTNVREAFALFLPPKETTVSEWAIEHRVLPKGTTARPGPFHPEVFQIEMMNAILDPEVHELVVMKPTQMGYSDAVLNNIIGYYIDVDPKPIMMVQTTIENAKDYGKKRITPMLESSPTLRNKIRPPKSRASGNTLSLKEFPGGFLKLTGANSGAGLRSDPVPIVVFDEVDGYPLDVDGEGDPLSIGSRRTDAFADWKIYMGSTPAKPKGISPIEKAYGKSDQRTFHVPCPFCGFFQALVWRDRKEVDGEVVLGDFRLVYAFDADDQLITDSVAYICYACAKPIPELYKQQMLNRGKWIAKYPDRPIVGFHLNALYSPWRENWNQLATEWKEAQRDPEKLKAFLNLRLAETWAEDADAVGWQVIKKRSEKFSDDVDVDVPHGVGLLTAGVDVQGDRLECVVKGWGAGEESWLIRYEQFFGDPGTPEVWTELDKFLLETFRHASGAKMGIKVTMIDSGGANTDEVYRFVKPRQSKNIWAIKGSSEAGREILGKFTMNNSYRVKLWSLGTDTAKDRIFARLKILKPGPGYMHFPKELEDEYFEQLTGEKAIRKHVRGRGSIRLYVKTRPRNEALDMEVYALAALYSLGQRKIRELKTLAEQLSKGTSTVEQAARTARPRAILNPGID